MRSPKNSHWMFLHALGQLQWRSLCFVFDFFFDSIFFYCGHRISFFFRPLASLRDGFWAVFFLLGVVVIGRFFIGAPCGAAIFTGPMTCRFAVLPSFTGFYRVLLPFFSIFTDSYLVYRVLPSYTRFSWFLPSLPSFTEYYLVFFRSFEPILTVFGLFFTDSYLVYRVLASWHLVWLVFTQFYRVLVGFTGFYLVLLGITGFYLVLLGFTEFYFVSDGALGGPISIERHWWVHSIDGMVRRGFYRVVYRVFGGGGSRDPVGPQSNYTPSSWRWRRRLAPRRLVHLVDDDNTHTHTHTHSEKKRKKSQKLSGHDPIFFHF